MTRDCIKIDLLLKLAPGVDGVEYGWKPLDQADPAKAKQDGEWKVFLRCAGDLHWACILNTEAEAKMFAEDLGALILVPASKTV